jgi:hypothetical protein
MYQGSVGHLNYFFSNCSIESWYMSNVSFIIVPLSSSTFKKPYIFYDEIEAEKTTNHNHTLMTHKKGLHLA